MIRTQWLFLLIKTIELIGQGCDKMYKRSINHHLQISSNYVQDGKLCHIFDLSQMLNSSRSKYCNLKEMILHIKNNFTQITDAALSYGRVLASANKRGQ